VTNRYSNTVSVISGSTNTVIGTIPVGREPFGIAFDSANGNLYVANFQDNTVSVISGSTITVIGTIPAGDGPAFLAFDSANGNIYVPNYHDVTLSVISTTGTVADTTPPDTAVTSAVINKSSLC
jgi:YVTN family beta-propeller protein